MKNIGIYIKCIIEGWVNLILDFISDIKYKDIFDERYRICKTCVHNNMGICNKCGCVLKAKTKAEDSECPLGLWSTVENTMKKRNG